MRLRQTTLDSMASQHSASCTMLWVKFGAFIQDLVKERPMVAVRGTLSLTGWAPFEWDHLRWEM